MGGCGVENLKLSSVSNIEVWILKSNLCMLWLKTWVGVLNVKLRCLGVQVVFRCAWRGRRLWLKHSRGENIPPRFLPMTLLL